MMFMIDTTTNKFNFETSKPFKSFLGGTFHRVTKKTFPSLTGIAIQALRLKKGIVREPHIHPNANQLDYCVSGKARVGIIGPEGFKQFLELKAGDISFVPQGYLHWIENIGTDELHFLVMLTNEEPLTIELSEMLHGVPKETLMACYGVSKTFVDDIPKKTVIVGDGSVL